MISKIFNNALQVHSQLTEDLNLHKIVEEISSTCITALKNGKKIIFCGNGGSFADAQHITAEFVGRFIKERQSLAAITLGCNPSSTTAVGNDYSFDDIFSRELSAIGQEGDVFIGITTSGNSSNILNAMDVALTKGLHTFGFTGNKKGAITQKCTCVEVPSNSTPRIQECHILIGHIICEMVDNALSS
ncbi:MAG: SIS domain-containing protein [Candidatus Margulisiibacteriota bacterium]|nr:SIS domain-containing protein [Candidatus Margulisiibacteriota bacterium]